MKRKNRGTIISIVVPSFKESQNLPILFPEIKRNIPTGYDYEIIIVDDDSPDGTFEVVEKFARKNKRIKGLLMYRRAGLQPSLLAGIRASMGDVVITMDADLQHPPALIPKMLKLWEKDYDLILPIKEDTEGDFFMKYLRNIGYKLWESISNGLIIPKVSEYRLMDRRVVNYILKGVENEVYIRGLVNLAARKSIKIPYKVGERKFGKSKFNLFRLIEIFLTGVVSFSTKPLRLALVVGLIGIPVSLIGLIVSFVLRLSGVWRGLGIGEYLLLIIGNFIILYLGVLGEYLGVMFREIKRRPTYMIGKKINLGRSVSS